MRRDAESRSRRCGLPLFGGSSPTGVQKGNSPTKQHIHRAGETLAVALTAIAAALVIPVITAVAWRRPGRAATPAAGHSMSLDDGWRS